MEAEQPAAKEPLEAEQQVELEVPWQAEQPAANVQLETERQAELEVGGGTSSGEGAVGGGTYSKREWEDWVEGSNAPS